MFAAVAEAGSFSKAARRLGISPSAVSQAIRTLEERLGAPLLRRSTRSVSLTDVGSDYLVAAAPALSQLRQAGEEASGRGGRPVGSLRLTMPRAPFELLIAAVLVAFQDAYPDVELEIAVERRMVDIVKEGYDAGLRYGDRIEKDMVAVLVAPRSEAVLVASPGYLQTRATPKLPRDLLHHRGLVCRSQATGLIIQWNLQCAGEIVQIVPPAATIVHDLASQIELAVRGLGHRQRAWLRACATSSTLESCHGSCPHGLPRWRRSTSTFQAVATSQRHCARSLLFSGAAPLLPPTSRSPSRGGPSASGALAIEAGVSASMRRRVDSSI